MSRFRTLGILAALSVAVLIGGCLTADQSSDAIYDKTTDTLRVLIIEHNITAENDADKAYAAALWHNRSDFLFSVKFLDANAVLRTGGHELLSVDLGQIGDKPKPIAVDFDLSQVKVQPGVFFRGEDKNSLCYYQQVDIPGPAIDGMLAALQKPMLAALASAAKDEIDRRSKGGAVSTWDDFRGSIPKQFGPSNNNATDQEKADQNFKSDPIHCLSKETLDMLATPPPDVKAGFARQGNNLSLILPLSPADQQDAIKTVPILKKEMRFDWDAVAGPGNAITISTTLTTAATVATYPFKFVGHDPTLVPPPTTAPADGPDWINAFGAKLDPTVTMQNIHDQFTKGTLPADQGQTSDKTRAELFKAAQ